MALAEQDAGNVGAEKAGGTGKKEYHGITRIR